MQPGRVAGRLPQQACGTLRGRPGLVLMQVRGLLDGDDEERENDGDSGERVHAPPDPGRITPVGHRLFCSTPRAGERPRRGTGRCAERERVAASCLAWTPWIKPAEHRERRVPGWQGATRGQEQRYWAEEQRRAKPRSGKMYSGHDIM